mmetsp:Transcript_75874/g.217154  ORF Transcript_75874/g.217154 Transcript_75874/m.217154 type:complete len:763 (+) Transcript_75874:52-2340(+)
MLFSKPANSVSMTPMMCMLLVAVCASLLGEFGAAASVGVVVEEAASVGQAVLAQDDECDLGSDTQCAVNAMQLRGKKTVAAEAASSSPSPSSPSSSSFASHAAAVITKEDESARQQAMEDATKLRQKAAQVEADAAAEAAKLRYQAIELQFQAHAEQAHRERGSFPTIGSRANQDPVAPANGSWHGGGLVDGLPGQEQVLAMEARDLDWHMGAIVYQVFVDRFAPPEDLESKRQFIQPPRTLHNWTDPVFAGVKDEETKYYTNELAFWGGDLKSLLSKLDYIKSMGNVLYLQPIFKAYSSHKYDTSDYFELDPEYGTLEDFTALADAVHAKGMHLVLDGVFNHMGIRSTWFQDAMASNVSKERNWYFIGEQYGKRGYKSWQSGDTLAELRLEDKSLQETIWNSSDSVVATWLKRGADGWRLDVGTEIGREFLWDLTQAAHRHKYGSLVVGEVSAYPRWWTESMDGVLSFWMGWIISGVVSGKMGGVFAGMQIQDLIYSSSMEQLLRSWIILSNHDLPRLTSKYPDATLRKFAVTLQFVLPGSVCIYYGEEIGMTGSGDPFNRAPMEWDKIGDGNEMYAHFTNLLGMRRLHRALRIGDFHQLLSFSLLAFIRRTDRIDEIVIILANPTDRVVEEQLNVPVEDILEYTLFRDILSNETVRIHGATCTMAVPPHSTRILTMVNEIGPNGAQYKRIYGHWQTFKGVEATFSLGNSLGELIRDPNVMSNGTVYDDGLKKDLNLTMNISPRANDIAIQDQEIPTQALS